VTRNRDFNLLWTGQVFSDLGGRVSSLALPLLVLAETHSPARAGVAGAVGSLPLLLFSLHAGAYVDRWNRKTVMLVADSARLLALASLAAALAFGTFVFAHVLLVALVDGAGFVFFSVSERASLRLLVDDEQLPAAMVRNQARDYGALLAGQPLGGLLFGVARVLPFAFDAASYLVSLATVAGIRTPFARERPVVRTTVRADLWEGLLWFWRQPFVRTTSLAVTGMDFALNGLYLVVIVVERQRGASPALIGATFVFLGAGGLVGSLVAPTLARRLPLRAIVIGTPLALCALMPLVLAIPGRVGPGAVYGAMFVMHPTWNATVGALRLRLAPDALQARVASVATLLSLGLVPLAVLAGGVLVERSGQITTLAVLFVVVLAALAVATRAAPPPSTPAPAP